jgi:hypothetical protein
LDRLHNGATSNSISEEKDDDEDDRVNKNEIFIFQKFDYFFLLV